MALLKSADNFSVARLESACHKALSYTPKPSYKSVQTIFKTGFDKIIDAQEPLSGNISEYGFTRDVDYYERKK